jgi:hypothetical protein
VHFTLNAACLLGGLAISARTWAQEAPVSHAPSDSAPSVSQERVSVADLMVRGAPEEPQITLAPDLWLARVRGNTTFGGPGFTVDSELGLTNYEAEFNGELSIAWGGFFRVMATGWTFSTSANATATQAGIFGNAVIGVGETTSSSFNAAGAGGEFDVTLFQPFADQVTPWSARVRNEKNTAEDGRYKADLRVKGIGAVRWYSASLSVTNLTNATSGSWSMDAVMPGIGGGVELDLDLRGRVPWVDSLSLEASGGTGSNFINEQYYTFIRASLSINFTPNIACSFGYRLEDFKLANGSATFDGGVQGLFVGALIRF